MRRRRISALSVWQSAIALEELRDGEGTQFAIVQHWQDPDTKNSSRSKGGRAKPKTACPLDETWCRLNILVVRSNERPGPGPMGIVGLPHQPPGQDQGTDSQVKSANPFNKDKSLVDFDHEGGRRSQYGAMFKRIRKSGFFLPGSEFPNWIFQGAQGPGGDYPKVTKKTWFRREGPGPLARRALV